MGPEYYQSLLFFMYLHTIYKMLHIHILNTQKWQSYPRLDFLFCFEIHCVTPVWHPKHSSSGGQRQSLLCVAGKGLLNTHGGCCYVDLHFRVVYHVLGLKLDLCLSFCTVWYRLSLNFCTVWYRGLEKTILYQVCMHFYFLVNLGINSCVNRWKLLVL